MDVHDATTIRKAFVNTSKSKAAAMNLPGAWPPARVEDRDFLGWVDPKAPQRAYVVPGPQVHDTTMAIELRLGETGPARRTTMCDWCHTSDVTSRLVVARRAGAAGKSGNTVGQYVCEDFDCSLRVRQPLKDHQRSVSGLPDTRVDDLVARVRSFVERVLA